MFVIELHPILKYDGIIYIKRVKLANIAVVLCIIYKKTNFLDCKIQGKGSASAWVKHSWYGNLNMHNCIQDNLPLPLCVPKQGCASL